MPLIEVEACGMAVAEILRPAAPHRSSITT
jgi:hypothetical protein